jgi:NitT/TauT family transport system ATP-binding protein
MTSSPKIAASGLRKIYATRRGEVTAIDGLDFAATAGEFVSIVGPSGCGKSTFLYILGGFVEASAGEATVDGAPIAGPDPTRGIVFQ